MLIRILAKDDAWQLVRARRLLERSRTTQQVVWFSNVALCETAWAMETTYGKTRVDIVDSFERLLTARLLQNEHEKAVRSALVKARAGGDHIADSIVGEVNLPSGCTHTVTFDKRLHRAGGFHSLLQPPRPLPNST